jgi:hypothetical protein
MDDNKELGSISDEHLKIIVDGEQAEIEKELQPDQTLDKTDQVKKGKKKKNFADPEGRNDQARIHG